MLRCVGDAKGLVFLLHKTHNETQCVFGAYTSEGIKLPNRPTGFNEYRCRQFSLGGHFDEPTDIRVEEGWLFAWLFEAGPTWPANVQLDNGRLSLGYDASGKGPHEDLRSCRQYIPCADVPDGYRGERNQRGDAVFGGSEVFFAEDLEVLAIEHDGDIL
mmetsp:Transcript_2974/g.7543  ORF Transcript_2974/g.7543 Transcript_2974/m.7543 type:complete len:159 (+) Transcript_2974:379-855(+)